MKVSLRLLFLLCVVAPISGIAQLTINFDFSYDTSGFFSGTDGAIRKGDLNAAAQVFENRMTQESFSAITPGGANSWNLNFTDPSDSGSNVTISNPALPANTVTIYVGARNLGGALGVAGFGYDCSGYQSWIDMFDNRNSSTNFDPFGGAISFDLSSPWYFDPNPSTLESFPGEYDFFSVAVHEIGHILGFSNGTNAFAALTSGTNFVGKAAEALYGGPIPLSPDLSHWAQGVTSGGYEVSMDPAISNNLRKSFTALDFAALQDIGYIVDAIPEPSEVSLVVTGFVVIGVSLRQRWRPEKS